MTIVVPTGNWLPAGMPIVSSCTPGQLSSGVGAVTVRTAEQALLSADCDTSSAPAVSAKVGASSSVTVIAAWKVDWLPVVSETV